MIKVQIINQDKVYEPVIEDNISIATERQNFASKTSLNIVKDQYINFQEGNVITIKFNEINVFYGFVFKKERSKDNIISVTAYDQLRYLKNKDTYVIRNKTSSEIVKSIITDFNLNAGDIDDTKFKIASCVEDNQTLFDVIQNSLSTTLQNTGQMYVLYDDFGKLNLKNIKNLIVPIVIDEETAENFRYISSIDDNVYNKIKLYRENEQTGKREIYIAQSGDNINKWGVLQYTESVDDNENAKTKADTLLKLYNQKSRTLSVSNALGDFRVRAGCTVYVKLNLGDVVADSLMLVEKCTHKIKNNIHTMDLTLRGGVLNG